MVLDRLPKERQIQFAMTTPRIRKSWKKKLLLVLFGLSLGLLMTEVFLRVIGYSNPLFYETDYYRGFALVPGAEGRWNRPFGICCSRNFKSAMRFPAKKSR
jgi:hypothetical protein